MTTQTQAPEPKLPTHAQLVEPFGVPMDVVPFSAGYSFVCYHTFGPYTLHKDGKPIRLTTKYNSSPWAAVVSESDGNVLREFAAAMNPAPSESDEAVAREILDTRENLTYLSGNGFDTRVGEIAAILARHRQPAPAATDAEALREALEGMPDFVGTPGTSAYQRSLHRLMKWYDTHYKTLRQALASPPSSS